jgi:hypothetical protein
VPSIDVEFTMDDSSIAGRTQKLRQEVALILQEERRYRNIRTHSRVEIAEHEKRGFRVLAIREELRTLFVEAKKKASHGSVWYS